MVTGLPDYQALSLNLTPALPNNDFAMTQCSHIFPEVLGNIVIGGSAANVSHASVFVSVWELLTQQEPLQEKEAATSWNTLKRFGCADVSAELGSATQGANLHRLENILTLDVRIHLLFDAMNLWFEAVKDQVCDASIIVCCTATRHLSSVAAKLLQRQACSQRAGETALYPRKGAVRLSSP